MMSSSIEMAKGRVIKFVQDLILDEAERSAITAGLISEKIDLVLSIKPEWGQNLDRQAVIDELIRRYSLWIGKDTTLKSEQGHQPWLNAERKKDWRYWQRYREWMEGSLSWKVADALDKSTDAVLELLEDPIRLGDWDRRGLVVGHVQSGKTAHYTGVICKAADAGYKIIIVLAGLHNNLRSQTQARLDEGFLGYATNPDPEILHFVGVGFGGRDANIKPNCATNRTEAGDFNTKVARHLAITPEQRPWLFVVKKNKTVLQRLLDWISNHVADSTDQTGRRFVAQLPILIVDDEADHASVDTGEQVFGQDGAPDDEHEPTAINSRIRKILRSFARSAYVGYTATPFANIFIHERGATREEGQDLFPSSFIINLAAPSNYVGPVRIFGLPDPEGKQTGLPLVRPVSDFASSDGSSGWMPLKHKNGYIPQINGEQVLPQSLTAALYAFVLACAARRIRGQGKEHCSMLVHVTRFNSVQREVHDQIETFIRGLRQRLTRNIGAESDYATLERAWMDDFIPASAAVRRELPDDHWGAPLDWSAVREVLPDVVAEIEVRMINGTAKDALDYDERRPTGLKVIAVGGDKLARGLTLEGLCTSYFLRASKMYDTLMQMGRWFGYRPGYLDLCRLYTTDELIIWFRHITEAAEELREEFDLMAASGATPREYGLKVQSHSVLMVTSRLKMRAARNLMLSFSGQLLETVALHRDTTILIANLAVARRLVSDLAAPEVNPERVRGGSIQKWQGYLWRDVSAERVIDFLSKYRTHSDAYKVNGLMLAEFIGSMVKVGELTEWTVALIGGGEGDRLELLPDVSVSMLKRRQNSGAEGRYSIRRLLSTRDESIDLDEAAWMAALSLSRKAWHKDPARRRGETEPDEPNGPSMRAIRGFGDESVPKHPERGLLLLYALDPKLAELDFPSESPAIIAFGISFPGSKSGTKVEYKVNNVLWDQEYGPAD
jgi:Z1 domain